MLQARRRYVIYMFAVYILSVGLTAYGASNDHVEQYFPKGVSVNVRRKPLTDQQRQYLKKLGVSDHMIDLWGDVCVSGYQADNFSWGDVRPDGVGPEKVKYDTTGIRKLSPTPPAGVHPRLFFTDADRPAERQRLLHTEGGQAAYKILMAETNLLKGTYDDKAFYAKPDFWKGTFGGTHGFLPLFREGNNNKTNKAIWDAYSHGRVIANADRSKGIYYTQLNLGLCAMEAYRCWLDDDSGEARLLAKAVETDVRAKLATLKPGERPKCANFNLDYIYDFIYNYMTPAQRQLIRGTIIAGNFDNNQYGCFQNASSTTSNWASFSYRIMSWLGIEGHPGFNNLQYLAYVRGMKNFLTYGVFKGGSVFEGLGKDQMGGSIIYVMQRRGDNLASHSHLLAYLHKFLPADILPWGDQYIAYDGLGGIKPLNENDLAPLHYLYPNDKLIDWDYRNMVHDDYGFMVGDRIRARGYMNNALKLVLFMTSYNKSNNDPGKIGANKTFFDGQRRLMITRSDWGKDATYLHLHCRGASGGHAYSDRNSIVFAGAGRIWIRMGSGFKTNTRQASVVDIDGKDIPVDAPAKMVDFKNNKLATFACGDAAPAWNLNLAAATSIRERRRRRARFISPKGGSPI